MFALEVVEHFRLNGSSLTMSSFTSILIFSQCIFSCFPASDFFHRIYEPPWFIDISFFTLKENDLTTHLIISTHDEEKLSCLPASLPSEPVNHICSLETCWFCENGVNRWKEAHLGLINIAEFPNFSKQLMVFFFNKRILFISMIFLLP